MSELSKQALLVDNNQSFPNNNAGAITPSVLRAFNTNMIDSTVNQTVFNAFSSSVESEFASMTGSVTSAITASSLITASFDNGTRNLTFTKGDSTTFAVNIPDVSGSSGDFVSTSSFNSYTASNDAKVNSLIAVTGSYVTSAITASSLVTASVNLNTITFTKGDASTFNITVDTGSGGGSLPAGVLSSSVTNFVDYSASVDTRINNIVSGTGFATTGSNSFNGNQNITGSVQISSQLVFGTSSLGPQIQTLGTTGLQVNAGESGSFSMRTLYGAGVGDAIIEAYDTFPSFNTGGKVSTKSGGGVDIIGYNGQIAITGSSTLIQGVNFTAFVNSVAPIVNPTLNPYSGSLILVANTFTSSSFAHLSASAGNQVNLVFKNNNNTADTIISGSNNIFLNPTAPAAGFKRYLGNGNIALGVQFPSLSGSVQFSPTINNNYIVGNISMRAPVSASLLQINNNSLLGGLNIGSTAVLNAEKLTGQSNISNNFVAGTLSLVANQSEIRTLTNITNNNINGGVTLNLSSSALIMGQNTINDSNFTLTNQFSSGAIGFGQAAVNTNTIGGAGNTFIITGSQPVLSPFQAGMNQSLVLGNTNIAFVNSSESRISGTNAYHTMIATGLIGNRLIVTGSSNLNDTTSFGSTFVGRFNASDGIRDKSSDVVFAVGTGTTTSTRKTGFLIDSGSNTFVEGTLNVSGSTTMTGSLSIAPTFEVRFATGSNQQAGEATMVAGEVIVSNSLVTANSIIMLTKQTFTSNHFVGVSAKSAGSFTISSSNNSDTDTVGWFIINNS